jgi:hypothetical protein
LNRGIHYSSEIILALEIGYEIIRINSGFIIYTGHPFKEFIEKIYKERANIKELKSPIAYILKIIINSLYGRLGIVIDNERFLGRIDDDVGFTNPKIIHRFILRNKIL